MTNAPTKIVPAEAFGTSEHCWLPIEDGVDPLFVQQQVGHRWGSTTALYTSVSSAFRTRTLRRVLDGAVGAALAPPPTTTSATTEGS
ncbi:MAG: hypothetical protein L0H64_21310 [Pseudonocardia sp.]|nr:hypothetical protein [Pseudonocardia sp.]